MSMHDRAAQFAPFAALVGYDDAVAETARLTESRPVLDEQEQKELDMRLRYLADHLKERLVVHIQYFVPDERKRVFQISEITPRIYPNGNILSEFGRIKTKTDLKKIPFAIILRKCCLILSGCKICFNNMSPGNEKCSKKFLIITVRCRFF